MTATAEPAVTLGFQARVLADSVSPEGHRLTTMEATFPRFILAEFNTHRVFSRNSASSRAIPVVKQLRRILESPFVPLEFGSNQPGMQAGPPLEGEAEAAARAEWLAARDDAVRHVLALVTAPGFVGPEDELTAALEKVEAAIKDPERPAGWLNVHKQIANRLLEPFMWHTVIVTATEWDNFWLLRDHPDAQPEIRRIAGLMREAWSSSEPARLAWGEWHLPLVDESDRESPKIATEIDLVKVSAGRCARVSYLTHAGKRDLAADIELHDQLVESGHMSPLEHPAQPIGPSGAESPVWRGNFKGWCAYRKRIRGEANPLAQGTIFELDDLELKPRRSGSRGKAAA